MNVPTRTKRPITIGPNASPVLPSSPPVTVNVDAKSGKVTKTIARDDKGQIRTVVEEPE